jgi:LuxR family maltose regulon positive regulatory protein
VRGHDTRVSRDRPDDGPSPVADTEPPAGGGHETAPVPPAIAVRRPRVMSALKRGDAPLVSVVAPGGYGKTTALAQWARDDGRAVAWVTVTDRNDDPVVLLAAIVEALCAAGLPAADRPATRSPSPWPAHAAAIAALPGEVGSPVILVLDDVHRLVSDEALGVVGALAQGVRTGSRLVLSGRAEVTSLVSAARAAGRVVELGPRELALTEAETAELLDALGLPSPPGAAAALTRHTEGWPAGVYLTALARGGTGGPGPFDGDVDRFVADYLWSEHLAVLPEDELMFLMCSAVLDRFSAAMCDAVLGRDDSARMIERAERSSLFVVPLDRVRRWYRYHDLFCVALRRELDRRDPAAAGTVLLRASDWCAENGLGEEAMAYAMEAGDGARIARLFASLTLPLYRVGRIATIERWLAEIERRGMIDGHPEVAVLGAVLHVFRGRPILAERWLDTAARATAAEGPREEQDPLLVGWLDLCEILMCRGGVAAVRDAAARALGPGRLPAVLAPPVMWMAANAAALLGDDGEVDAMLEETARAAEATGGIMAAVAARGQLAVRALARGEGERAHREISSARTLVSHAPFDGYVEMAILLAAEAHLLATEADAAAAEAVLASAERLRPSLSRAFPVFSVEALLEMARAHLALGDPRDAGDCVTQAERIVSQSGPLGRLGEDCAGVRALADAAPAGDRAFTGLTGAEVRLLPLLATHLTLEEIGERLFVSRNTVKKHAASIYRKLGASSRHEAVVRATAAGLLDAPSAALDRTARR